MNALVIKSLFICWAFCFFSLSAVSKNLINEFHFEIDADTSAPAHYYSPKKAAIHSAILPGWGQINNKKYWKLPLVYGALGTTAGIFVYNLTTYKDLKNAYIYISDNDPANDILINPQFKNLSANAIRSYRNSFRQNIDYSVLVFMIFWGLNVVDASVDAHLKSFDVNDNLSLRFRPGYSPLAKTNGLSLLLEIGNKKTSK